MSTSQLITIIGIVVSCSTAFLVGYWHRKQIRQVELFRQDPSAGITPPDSALFRFLKAKGDLLLGVGLPGIILLFELLRTGPITRFSLLVVSLNSSIMIGSILMYVLERTLHIISGISKIQEKHTDLLEQYSGMFERHTGVIEKHTDMFDKVINPAQPNMGGE